MLSTSSHSFSSPSLSLTSSTNSNGFSETIRDLISDIIAPFKQDYRHWPWAQIGTIAVVCIGSYSLYRCLPAPYRRYYMFSTRDFARRYNEAMHTEKERLFSELKSVRTRDEGRKIQVVEIGAAHGANMAYYPHHREIDRHSSIGSFSHH
jgi:hypothetical protein